MSMLMDEMAPVHLGIIKEAFIGGLAAGATKLVMRAGKSFIKHPVANTFKAVGAGMTASDMMGASRKAEQAAQSGFRNGALMPATNM